MHMKVKFVFLLFYFGTVLWFASCKPGAKITEQNRRDQPKFAIVIHGGAGYIKNLPPEIERKYKEALRRALHNGYAVLERGGSATDAVVAAITTMEDDTLFNAGRGAVLNRKGGVELDASVMDGKTLNAGAVASVSHIKNPILAARLVMDSSRHVFLIGNGAEAFAKQYGLETVPEIYFITGRRKKQWQRLQTRNKQVDAGVFPEEDYTLRKYGTVGCVAMDKNGNLAAGTSTGGLMNKSFGRVGDSPVIGAGTYADNRSCAVSATGTGEYFIRTVAAFRVTALMQYENFSLNKALRASINEIQSLGGDGGFIGIDNKGNVAWFFNTEGMFRAYKTSEGEEIIEMYRD